MTWYQCTYFFLKLKRTNITEYRSTCVVFFVNTSWIESKLNRIIWTNWSISREFFHKYMTRHCSKMYHKIITWNFCGYKNRSFLNINYLYRVNKVHTTLTDIRTILDCLTHLHLYICKLKKLFTYLMSHFNIREK